MKTIPMNLTIDRHITNGSARIRGSVDGEKVDLSIERGVEDANAYVNGQVGSEGVNLTFVRHPFNGYESAVGWYGQTRMNGQLQRHQPDGDTTLRQNEQALFIDRQDQGSLVSLSSASVNGGFQREPRDGDEFGRMATGRKAFDYRLDRDESSGNFTLTGQSPDGPFRLEGRRTLSDGDLSLSGTAPEGMKLFPVLWEILGDDKNIPDRNPEYPGSVMAMSLFFHQG